MLDCDRAAEVVSNEVDGLQHDGCRLVVGDPPRVPSEYHSHVVSKQQDVAVDQLVRAAQKWEHGTNSLQRWAFAPIGVVFRVTCFQQQVLWPCD